MNISTWSVEMLVDVWELFTEKEEEKDEERMDTRVRGRKTESAIQWNTCIPPLHPIVMNWKHLQPASFPHHEHLYQSIHLETLVSRGTDVDINIVLSE